MLPKTISAELKINFSRKVSDQRIGAPIFFCLNLTSMDKTLILRSDVNRKRIELLDSTSLDRVFARSGNAAGRGRGRTERVR